MHNYKLQLVIIPLRPKETHVQVHKQKNQIKPSHYLSYTKISQTKCYKQSDTMCKLRFHCSFRWCAPFCSLCWPLRPLLLIGGKVSTANQDPPKEWFLSATQRAKRSTPSERAMKTELKTDVRLFVAFCLTYFIV